MAILHRAELNPTKRVLLESWLPGRPWGRGAGADTERVASCRFDDPAGKVGIETMLVRTADGTVLHVPLTYRDAPLAGADGWLIGTTEHSVLGTRWVYDAAGDPVYAAALAGAIVAGTGQAEELVQAADGSVEHRTSDLAVSGSGVAGAAVPAVTAIEGVADEDPTVITTDEVELAVVRVVDTARQASGASLTGTWDGVSTPALLAWVVSR